MLNLKLTSIIEAHKLSGDVPVLLLIDVTIVNTQPQVVLRFAKNVDDVVFRGNTYNAFNFELDIMESNSTGQLPQVKLSVSNVTRALEGYLEQYDGGVDSRVTLYAVPVSDLSGDPDLEMDFYVTDAAANKDYVVFTLGADSPLRQGFPFRIFSADHCGHVYNSPGMRANNDPRGLGCNYQGALLSCSLTLEGPNGCRAHANSARFGGFPGIATQGFRSASVK